MSYIKVSGTWKETSTPYIKVSGTWKEGNALYYKQNGAWTLVWGNGAGVSSPLSSILSSTSVRGIGFTPNFCVYYFEGKGEGGYSSYSAVASAISTNTTGTLAGYGNIKNSSMQSKSGTATFGNGTLSVSMNTGITVNSTTGICGYATNAVFGSFSASNNSFAKTISTNFTPNFVAVCCNTVGTGGNSGYYYTLCGWTTVVGAATTSGGNMDISVSYSTSGVTLTADYQSSHRYETIRYIVARI